MLIGCVTGLATLHPAEQEKKLCGFCSSAKGPQSEGEKGRGSGQTVESKVNRKTSERRCKHAGRDLRSSRNSRGRGGGVNEEEACGKGR